MTPAGRPPRSSSISKKTITIRLTEEEKEMLAKAAWAADAYVSDWLRVVGVAAAKVKLGIEEPAQPLPSAEPTPTTQQAFDAVMAEMLVEVPEAKRAQARAVLEPLMSLFQGMMNNYEERIKGLSDALQIDIDRADRDLEIATKFAKHIKHDRGCKKHPCQCSIKDIALEVGTALVLNGGKGDIPNH